MALRGGQGGDEGAGIERKSEIAEQFRRPCPQLPLADDDAAAEVGPAGEDILGDRQLFEDFRFLRHIGNAPGSRRAGRVESNLLAIDPDRPVVASGGVDAVEDLDESRLAGAVLAEQGMDLSAPNAEIDSAQRLNARKAFDDLRCFDDVVGVCFRHLVSRSPPDSPATVRRLCVCVRGYWPALSRIL